MIADLKIIELSTVLAGPAVGMFFAELGADVLKIEHPFLPDVTRTWKLPAEDPATPVSAYFSSVNYRKRYRRLDLASAEGKAALAELIAASDVLLMNFKKGDDAKFDLTTETIAAINPKMIIGKITGFGDESDRVAYDLILQAETGFMSMNGTPESGPVKMPVALIDVLAAHQLKQGILVALLERGRTGKGAAVSVSLYDAAVSSLMNQASNFLMAQHIPKRIGSLHPNIAPYGELFTTADNKLITFAIGSNAHFRKLCGFFDIPEVAEDVRFADNAARVQHRNELRQLLQTVIATLDASAIDERMQQLHIPMGIVRSLDQVFADTAAQKLIREEELEGQATKRVTGIAFRSQPLAGNKRVIRSPQTEAEWESYYDLRYRIMREPLGKERGSERNEGDVTGIHIALFEETTILAIARLDKVDETTCQVRFVAVESSLQGQGLGKLIMDAVEKRGRSEGFSKLVLHARDYALPFYKKLGYTLIGPSYKLFDVLQHYEMEKAL